MTALMRAIAGGHVSTAKLLVKNKANVEAKDQLGRNAEQFSREEPSPNNRQMYLQILSRDSKATADQRGQAPGSSPR